MVWCERCRNIRRTRVSPIFKPCERLDALRLRDERFGPARGLASERWLASRRGRRACSSRVGFGGVGESRSADDRGPLYAGGGCGWVQWLVHNQRGRVVFLVDPGRRDVLERERLQRLLCGQRYPRAVVLLHGDRRLHQRSLHDHLPDGLGLDQARRDPANARERPGRFGAGRGSPSLDRLRRCHTRRGDPEPRARALPSTRGWQTTSPTPPPRRGPSTTTRSQRSTPPVTSQRRPCR